MSSVLWGICPQLCPSWSLLSSAIGNETTEFGTISRPFTRLNNSTGTPFLMLGHCPLAGWLSGPLNDNVHLICFIDCELLQDADGNKIQQWTDVKTEGGVRQLEFPLSDRPPLGDWTITVTADQVFPTRTRRFLHPAVLMSHILPYVPAYRNAIY